MEVIAFRQKGGINANFFLNRTFFCVSSSLHCRQNNTQVLNFMHGLNITDAKLLEAFYLSKIFEIVESYSTSKKNYAGNFIQFWTSFSVHSDKNFLNQFAVWQEAFQNGQGQLSKKAIVHVWKKEDWQNVTLEVYNQKTASRKFLMKIILGYKRGHASPIVRSLVPQLHFLWHRLAQLLQNRPTRLQWF